MLDHGRDHWIGLKWLLRYLNGASSYGLVYKAGAKSQDGALVGFCDSDYAANRDNRRSQTGYVFNLYGTTISWKSGLQHVVALSTTEAEYIAMTEAVKEAIWLKGIHEDFGERQDAVYINCDSST
ncbi:secreted RxLR effector protein 161-like [Salvia splendens]|uniref:secreted RxLR effector protein 161-like n=1 Tax=Salvia splendens TaxID=180675 RepID=UPI001C25E9A7|nr:secreted RxLR effector protein 161-like [Salvia splendens]